MYTIEAGIGMRRAMRQWFMERNIDFKEDKGWIDSLFYAKLTPMQAKELEEAINYANN